MSKGFLVAFVAVAGVATAFVDYVNESRRAGVPIGALAAQDYVATVGARIDAARTETGAAAERLAFLSIPLRDHLPEAPAGWLRREWTEIDQAVFYGGNPDPTDLVDLIEPRGGLSVPPISASAAIRPAELWVYEREGARVSVRLRKRPKQTGGLIGFSDSVNALAAANMKSMTERRGFAVVEGVTVIEDFGMFGAEPRPYRVFEAVIGPDVIVNLRADAPDAAILEILNALDIDRLNRLNDTPQPGIGSAAPRLSDAEQLAAAEASGELLIRRQRLEARLSELSLQEASLEMLHGNGSMSDADHAAARAKLDQRRARLEADLAELMAEPGAPGGELRAVSGEGFGFLTFAGRVAGLFGSAGAADGAAATDGGDQPEQPRKRLFDDDCTSDGTFKRCRVTD